jgi:hypothetical protein
MQAHGTRRQQKEVFLRLHQELLENARTQPWFILVVQGGLPLAHAKTWMRGNHQK